MADPQRYTTSDIGGRTYRLRAERSPGALMDTAIRSANGIVTFPKNWNRHDDGSTTMDVFVPDYYIREWETRLRWTKKFALDISWEALPRSGPPLAGAPAASLGDLGPLSRPSFLATLGPSIAPRVNTPPVQAPSSAHESLREAMDILAGILGK